MKKIVLIIHKLLCHKTEFMIMKKARSYTLFNSQMTATDIFISNYFHDLLLCFTGSEGSERDD